MNIKILKKFFIVFVLTLTLVLTSCQSVDTSSDKIPNVDETTPTIDVTIDNDSDSHVKMSAPSPTFTSESSTEAKTTEEMFVNVLDLANEFTVTVICLDNTTSTSMGSGVIYSKNENQYFVLTNHHVVEDMTSFYVKTTKEESEIKATLIGAVKEQDIAILCIESEIEYPIVKFEKDEVKKGQYCFAVGTPISIEYQNNSTIGNVSLVDEEKLIHTASINAGNSGGPLINSKGNLIGINNAKLTGETASGSLIENMFFAINLKTIEKAIDLINEGKSDIFVDENGEIKDSHITLGITVVSVSIIREVAQYPTYISAVLNGINISKEEYDEYIKISSKISSEISYGLYIIEIDEGSNGENFLKIGDVLISINEMEIYSTLIASEIINNLRIGQTISYKIYRDNNYISDVFTLKR